MLIISESTQSMSIHLVIQTCQTLSDSGKKPSTALVKSQLLRSGNNLPLAQIIKGIRLFSEGNNRANTQTVEPQQTDLGETGCSESCACKTEIVQLKQQIMRLEDKFTNLQIQVSALKSG